MKKFLPSPNKEIIRAELDTELIKSEYRIKGKKLAYFGLPSDGLYDILAWKEYLGQYDAVEKGEENHESLSQHFLMLTAFKHGISKNLRLLRGDINDILINGFDETNQSPRFPFDVVNLDYYGGMLHNGDQKVKAIEQLIEKQVGTDFLLIMTFDVKEEDGGEKINTLSKIEQLLLQHYPDQSKEIQQFISWYKSSNASDVHRQKVYLPYFLKHPAEDKHFKIYFHEPVIYEGTKNAPMIHFVCRMTYEANTTTASVSDQSLIDVLNLKVREVKNGEIVDSSIQAPKI